MVLNSSFAVLMIVLLGRSNLGLGAMKFETTDAKKLMIPSPILLKNLFSKKELERFIITFAEREIGCITEELENEDKNSVDERIASYLNLSNNDLRLLHDSICNLTQIRLNRSKSY